MGKMSRFPSRMRVSLLHNFPLEMSCFHRRKHFMSLHKQDKKVFIFPNTPRHLLHVPVGYNVCTAIDSFKVKSLKGGFQRRPELIAQCEVNGHSSTYPLPTSKAVEIQLELAEKALYLLDTFLNSQPSEQFANKCKIPEPPRPKFALDIGCGSGISMVPLVNRSYFCVGADLNMQSLACLKQKEDRNHSSCPSHSQSIFSAYKNVHSSGAFDVIRWDLRHGLPFHDNVFDLSISISFLQWLFYGHRSQQLTTFFSSLHKVLCPGGKCVIQFYPSSPKQLSDAINHASLYFKGAVVGDYPHIDRGRKLFLLLFS